MSLIIANPQLEIERVVRFLTDTFTAQNIKKAVIAVSGGIDSAVSLAILSRSLKKENVYPLFLPYAAQDMSDAKTVCEWAGISPGNCQEIPITEVVESLVHTTSVGQAENVRLGNIMARVRMIITYDVAKKLHAMVCGTENKSETYLGYFTRFGDGASDIEPLRHLYKTQVRQIARELDIPDQIYTKPPSAGLWIGQTDAKELGFSYEDADKVLEQYVDGKKSREKIVLPGITPKTIAHVIDRVQSQEFKQKAPYNLS